MCSLQCAIAACSSWQSIDSPPFSLAAAALASAARIASSAFAAFSSSAAALAAVSVAVSAAVAAAAPSFASSSCTCVAAASSAAALALALAAVSMAVSAAVAAAAASFASSSCTCAAIASRSVARSAVAAAAAAAASVASVADSAAVALAAAIASAAAVAAPTASACAVASCALTADTSAQFASMVTLAASISLVCAAHFACSAVKSAATDSVVAVAAASCCASSSRSAAMFAAVSSAERQRACAAPSWRLRSSAFAVAHATVSAHSLSIVASVAAIAAAEAEAKAEAVSGTGTGAATAASSTSPRRGVASALGSAVDGIAGMSHDVATGDETSHAADATGDAAEASCSAKLLLAAPGASSPSVSALRIDSDRRMSRARILPWSFALLAVLSRFVSRVWCFSRYSSAALLAVTCVLMCFVIGVRSAELESSTPSGVPAPRIARIAADGITFEVTSSTGAAAASAAISRDEFLRGVKAFFNAAMADFLKLAFFFPMLRFFDFLPHRPDLLRGAAFSWSFVDAWCASHAWARSAIERGRDVMPAKQFILKIKIKI